MQGRNAVSQQKQRLSKLASSLNSLDEVLRTRTFLVGERLTLADTNLAVDILPLFNAVQDGGQPLIKKVCPSAKLVHLRRWHETIIHQPPFEAVYNPNLYKINLGGGQAQAPLKILCLHGYRYTGDYYASFLSTKTHF